MPASDFEEDVSVGRWGLICADHGGCIVIHDRATARYFMARPEEWCPVCQEAIEENDK